MIGSPQEKPLQAKAKIEITTDEIKAGLIANQRNFSQAVLSSKSLTEKQVSTQWHGAEDVITRNSDLNREQVEGVLRLLVASRAHLRENVAVLPVVHLTEIVAQARDVAYRKIIAHEAYQSDLPSKEPLKEPKDCKDKEELAQRNAEERKRAQQERELGQNEAVRVLADNNFVLSKLVLCFLEAMITDPDNFLGNPLKKNLPFAECQQFIIPMRTGTNYQDYSDTHYDVVVVDCNRETMTAEATFYDSMGWELGILYKRAIEDFFKEKGFQISFKNVAKKDQQDSYNCGTFAVLRAIEIASQNRGVAETLIQKFHQENYKETSDNFRVLFGNALKELGFKIKVDEALEKSTAHSRKGSSCLRDFAALLDNLNREIQQISNLPEAAFIQNVAPSTQLNANLIFDQCDRLRCEMQKMLKQKMILENKTPEDEKIIQFLMTTILTINSASREYIEKMKDLTAPQEEGFLNTTLSFLFNAVDHFSSFSRTKKLIYGGLGLAATVFGSTLLLKLMAFLPTNPLILIGVSAVIGFMVLEGSKIFFKGSDSAEKKAKVDAAAAAATKAILLEIEKSIELDKAIASLPSAAPALEVPAVVPPSPALVPPVEPVFAQELPPAESTPAAVVEPPAEPASAVAQEPLAEPTAAVAQESLAEPTPAAVAQEPAVDPASAGQEALAEPASAAAQEAVAEPTSPAVAQEPAVDPAFAAAQKAVAEEPAFAAAEVVGDVTGAENAAPPLTPSFKSLRSRRRQPTQGTREEKRRSRGMGNP